MKRQPSFLILISLGIAVLAADLAFAAYLIWRFVSISNGALLPISTNWWLSIIALGLNLAYVIYSGIYYFKHK